MNRKIFLSIFFLVSIIVPASADVLTFSDGRELEGIVEERDGAIWLDGVKFNPSEIVDIEYTPGRNKKIERERKANKKKHKNPNSFFGRLFGGDKNKQDYKKSQPASDPGKAYHNHVTQGAEAKKRLEEIKERQKKMAKENEAALQKKIESDKKKPSQSSGGKAYYKSVDSMNKSIQQHKNTYKGSH